MPSAFPTEFAQTDGMNSVPSLQIFAFHTVWKEIDYVPSEPPFDRLRAMSEVEWRP
jgi:hypothetical protein